MRIPKKASTTENYRARKRARAPGEKKALKKEFSGTEENHYKGKTIKKKMVSHRKPYITHKNLKRKKGEG